jgi:thioredoxin 1
MGKLINSNQEEFQGIIESETGIVLVDFHAIWCGPCRMLTPVLQSLSEEVDVTIIKVNVDENPELSAKYGVRNIPVVFVLKNGEELERIVGLKDKNTYISTVEKYTTSNESED